MAHAWLVPLRDAIRARGGVVDAREFLRPENVTAMGGEPALAARCEAAGEEGRAPPDRLDPRGGTCTGSGHLAFSERFWF